MSEVKSEVKSAEVDVYSKLDDSIAKLSDQSRTRTSAAEAMQFSQAALNLAHAKSVLKNTELTVKMSDNKAEATTAAKK